MRGKIALAALSLLILSSIFGLMRTVEAYDGNEATAQLDTLSGWGTEEDIIENVPVPCGHSWCFQICNHIDGTGEPVNDPRITIETDLTFAELWPEPTLSGPPIYEWDYTGLSIPEGISLGIGAQETLEPRWLSPGLTASRSVSPERLVEPVTYQTVVVAFTLEDPQVLEDMDYVCVEIGPPTSIFEGIVMIESTVASWEPVEGWFDSRDRANSVGWRTDASNVVVGQAYQFEATMETNKSDSLLGSPIFKPEAAIYYGKGLFMEPVTGTSVTVDRPGVITATFEASNEICWLPCTTDSWHFNFLQFVTEYIDIPPPGPPFNVLIRPTIDIDPDTLNLIGNGKWVTAYIELPENYYPDEIDISSIQLEGFLPVDPAGPTEIGDYDVDGVPDLMVKFDRAAVQEYLGGSATTNYDDETRHRHEVTLWIFGSLFDGTLFAGTDTIWVVSK